MRRKFSFEQTLTGGRSVTLIVRNGQGVITDLVPLGPTDLSVYSKTSEQGYPTKGYRTKTAIYEATEIIELNFMLKHNMIDVRGPIMTNKNVIGLAIASSRCGSKAFQSGGIPLVALQGSFTSGVAAQRASEDVANATIELAREGRPVMALLVGHEFKPSGFHQRKCS